MNMNFAIYPVKDSPFYNTGEKVISNNKANTCLPAAGQGFDPLKDSCKIDLSDGYNKPLNEVLKPIHYSIATKDPDKICSDSPWNNMTRRISLVKDY